MDLRVCLFLAISFGRPVSGLLQLYLTTDSSPIVGGQPVVFKCTVQCTNTNNHFSWFLDGRRLHNGVAAPTFVFRDSCTVAVGFLTFTPLRSDAGKIVKCAASNGPEDVANETSPLEIYYEPENTAMCVRSLETCDDCVDCTRNATVGDTLELDCTALRSNPASHLIWEVTQHQHDMVLPKMLYKNVSSALHNNISDSWDSKSAIMIEIPAGVSSVSIECRIFYPDSTTIFKDKHLRVLVQTDELNETVDTDSPWKLPIICSTSVIGFVFFVCLCCFVVKRRRRLRWGMVLTRQEGGVTLPMVGVIKQKDSESPEMKSGETSVPDTEPTDETTVSDLEFRRDKVKLERVIGDGFFGQVYKAVAEGILHDGENTTVAVKVMKGHSSITDFKNELDIFKALKKHPFVVSFLGSCTEREPFYLIMEYISFGTLEGYIRKKRLAWDEARLANRPMKEALSPARILMFAYQIACGMEYLSSVHLVHRDLATRNVLLGEGLTCKLCDFGLARDVTGTEQYTQSSMGAVPFRWLALECLLQNAYTTKSDVWSFGVLLWELVTLGAQPYPNMSFEVIFISLKSGFRLPMPLHCGKELYDMMSSCWKEHPESRPSFSELREGLDYLLKCDSEMLDMSRFATDQYVYQNVMLQSCLSGD